MISKNMEKKLLPGNCFRVGKIKLIEKMRIRSIVSFERVRKYREKELVTSVALKLRTEYINQINFNVKRKKSIRVFVFISSCIFPYYCCYDIMNNYEEENTTKRSDRRCIDSNFNLHVRSNIIRWKDGKMERYLRGSPATRFRVAIRLGVLSPCQTWSARLSPSVCDFFLLS